MPHPKRDYAVTYTKNKKRYKARFRKQWSGKGLKVVKSLNVIPYTPLLALKRFGKLPYNEQSIAVSPGVGVATAYVYSANGLFDPNITGTGHQPMGFDQMMLFYEHYTVSKCKMTVNFFNYSADLACVGLLIAPDATIETVITRLNENGMLAKKYLQPKNEDGSITSVTILVDISKINGKKDVKSENDFRGDVASNPVEQTYLHIFCYNPIAGAAADVRCDVMIEYDAVFTEPRKMIQS